MSSVDTTFAKCNYMKFKLDKNTEPQAEKKYS